MVFKKKQQSTPQSQESKPSPKAVKQEEEEKLSGDQTPRKRDVKATAKQVDRPPVKQEVLPPLITTTEDVAQGGETITDKEFYKAMQRLKERHNTAEVKPPKKSASAYILYGKEKRVDILKVHPHAKVTEVVKEIAKCWSSMGKEEKQKYKDKAKRDKDRYEKELRRLGEYNAELK